LKINEDCPLINYWHNETGKICQFMGFPSGAFKVSVILGYDTATVGDWCPTLRDNAVVSSSREEMSEENNNWTLKDETATLSRNFRCPAPTDAVLHPRRSEIVTLRSKIVNL